MKQKLKPLFVVELYGGRIGLTTDTKREVLADEGRNNVKDYRRATKDDIAWVANMGGYVPNKEERLNE